jgi:hypothetical protein
LFVGFLQFVFCNPTRQIIFMKAGTRSSERNNAYLNIKLSAKSIIYYNLQRC